MKRYRGKRVALLAPLVIGRKGYYTELAEWAAGRGYAALRVDGVLTPTDAWPRLDRFKEHDIELPVAELDVRPAAAGELADALARAVKLGRNMVRVLPRPESEGADGAASSSRPSARARRAAAASSRSTRACSRTTRATAGAPSATAPASSSPSSTTSRAARRPRGPEARRRRRDLRGVRRAAAASPRRSPCGSTARTSPRSRRARSRTRSPTFKKLKLEAREREIARDVVPELVSRLGFLDLVGLGYLTLDRAAPTLSGGEAQRIRLAAQLGSNLRGVCYILDEPTIGLHPRDNALLLDTIEKLVAKGNTVVVVEHDEETIRRAEHVVDLGPGAGRNGGEVVVNGSLRDLLASERSITGRVLASPPQHPLRAAPQDAQGRRRHGVARARRRHAPQPAQARRRAAARAARLRDGRQRQRQEHADPRRARGQSRAARRGAPRSSAEARASDELDGLAGHRPRARGRSDADRQDAALVPRDLRRHLRRGPQAVRRDDRSAAARLRREPLLVQRGRAAAARAAKGRASRRSR